MMDLDVTFEDTPWDRALAALRPGDRMPVLQFLTLTEGEESAEEALDQLEESGIGLDIRQLPAVPVGGALAVRLKQEQQLAEKEYFLEDLEKNDPLRLYLEDLAAMPVTGDMDILAQQSAAGDENARQMLLNLSLSRVVQLARQNTGKGVLLMDLIQEGSLGLWKGILNYRQGDFASHRDWWICQYIARAVAGQARSGGLGQKLRQGMEDYRDVDQQLLCNLGRNPTLEEIAQQMHISTEEALVYENMMQQARTRQQVETAMEAPEETPEDRQAVEDTAYFQERQRISDMLESLPGQDAKLLTLRFGLEGGLPLSPEDTGRQLGLTVPEVLQREAAALAKLRENGQKKE